MKFRVRLYNFSAVNLPAADKNGTSDPYLKINFDSFKKLPTDPVSKTLNPVWDLDLTFVYETRYSNKLGSKSMVIECFDKNRLLSDTFIGRVTVDLHTLASGPVNHDLQLWMDLRPAGRIKFSVEMEQLADITVFFRDVIIHNLPLVDGKKPNVVLKVAYSKE